MNPLEIIKGLDLKVSSKLDPEVLYILILALVRVGRTMGEIVIMLASPATTKEQALEALKRDKDADEKALSDLEAL